MKLQDAMKKTVGMFGAGVISERRLFYILDDFLAFDEYPAMKQAMRVFSRGSYGRDLLCRGTGREGFLKSASEAKRSLAIGGELRREFADYAIDCVSFALGHLGTVDEPMDHGFEAEADPSAAGEGDVYMQLLMGEKCFYGDGVPQDYAEALSWYRKAADQGDAGAGFCMGWMYENGLGVTRDYAEALKWYSLAAEQDYAEAENSLGDLYRSGLGVPRDYGEAVRWFYRAARQGSADAENSLGTMYANGLGVPRDYEEAVRWYLRAAARQHPTARYNLGCLCEHGLGTPKDDAKALSLFRLAAEGGDPDAKKKLEFLSRLDEPRQQRMGWAGRLIHAFGLGGK